MLKSPTKCEKSIGRPRIY